MTRLSSFNSAAFRFALLIAGVFALGSVVLLGVVEHSIRSYATEATVVGLRAETAMLTEDWPDVGGASSSTPSVGASGRPSSSPSNTCYSTRAVAGSAAGCR